MNGEKDPLAALLATNEFGDVLDLACGSGQFIKRLAALGKAASWTGLDRSGAALEKAAAQLDGKLNAPLRLLEEDVHRTSLPSASCDTVSLSVSLHHVERPTRVLSEMVRVVKPGGRIVICEMIADHLDERQRLHRELHHLSAAVDRLQGRSHRPTYRLRDLRRLLSQLPCSWRHELLRPADWPVTRLNELEGVHQAIRGLKARLGGVPDTAELRRRLATLEKRMNRIGWGWQSQLLAVGKVQD